MSLFCWQLLTCVSLVLSKLRAKLGLKPLEVNAVKKGECGTEDGGEGGHLGGGERSSEGVFEEDGVMAQVQHHLVAMCVYVCVYTHPCG